MKKHTVFAWNSRRILIEVVEGDDAASTRSPLRPTMNHTDYRIRCDAMAIRRETGHARMLVDLMASHIRNASIAGPELRGSMLSLADVAQDILKRIDELAGHHCTEALRIPVLTKAEQAAEAEVRA